MSERQGLAAVKIAVLAGAPLARRRRYMTIFTTTQRRVTPHLVRHRWHGPEGFAWAWRGLLTPNARDHGYVTLMLLALAGGVMFGYARDGRLARLGRLPLRRNRLLLTAISLYVLGVLGSLLWEPLLGLLSGLAWLTIAFYAWVNRAVQGFALVAAGLAANGLVLLLNAAMPVSVEAAERAGADPEALLAPTERTELRPDTLLPWLGKTVPIAFPPRPEVVSPGDVAVAAGLALAVAVGMMGQRPDREPDPRLVEHETMERVTEPHGSVAL
jgi:Family of unknown function (DUF5317)